MTWSTALTVVRRIAIVAAFAVVLIRPEYGERTLATDTSDVEVLVVVDRTRSMAALDHGDGQPRIRGAQRDLRALVEGLPGTRFSLVTWATAARHELPFTTDHGAILNALETMRLQDPYDGPGTQVGTPLRELVTVLKQADEQHPDRRRMLLFISDGENTTGGQPPSYERLAPYLDGGLVLGYGTPDGARMPLADDLTDAEGYVQFEGSDAISTAGRGALRAVAEQTGSRFVARTGPGGIEDLTSAFAGTFTEQADERLTAAHDLTWVAGLALVPLLLWELYAHWRSVWVTPTVLGPRRRPRAGEGES